MSGECCLGFVFFDHFDLIIAWESIHEGEEHVGSGIIDRGIDMWQWKVILGASPLLISYFVCFRFACWTLKNPKMSFSLRVVMRIYIMAWRNPFRHWSAQSAFFSQNDQNALGQPWVDQRAKSSQNNIFHVFISNLSSSEIFRNFDQVWLEVDP